jgi:hypothetical protein
MCVCVCGRVFVEKRFPKVHVMIRKLSSLAHNPRQADAVSGGSAPSGPAAARGQGRVVLVATGALTNVALLLALYPEVTECLRDIVIMGGAIGIGNTSPGALLSTLGCLCCEQGLRWTDPELPLAFFHSFTTSHTHIHTHTYIYIYTKICICTKVQC